jgi:uncharacterized protein YajQ (UPF0234 family)
MAKESSFDVVSKTDFQEVINALHQAQKEIETRFDFKGSKSSLDMQGEEIVVIGDDDFKLTSVIDILQTKLIKRNVTLKSLDYGKVESAAQGTVRQVIKIKQGISQEVAKQIVKDIKDSKMKVQASIQGDQVRVTSKEKDDLQSVIRLLQNADYSVDLQFTNYR